MTVTTNHQSLAALRVNGTRLMSTLHSTCDKFGAAHRYGSDPTETGMARLSLNDDDKAVRLWLVEQVTALGCKVSIDQLGNLFAVRAGRNNDVAPVMMGSHLDTQPTGGRYDGVLGVMAALEVLRTLHENDYTTEGPVGLINWTNEEGARFPMITMASGVWAGSIPLEVAWNCVEVTPPTDGSEPRTVKQELERIGFLGDVPASYESNPIAAHFELHIEQGPVLEDEGQKIGVVTGAQGYSWYEVTVMGRDSHAGTTPLSARKDALLAAARMVAAGNEVAKKVDGFITTGRFDVEPGSVNTVAKKVTFTLDVRHPENSRKADMAAQCRGLFDKIAKEECGRGVEVHWKTLAETDATVFHEDCIKVVEESAEEVCGRLEGISQGRKLWRHMLSGAGHDSCHVSKRCPTAMVFTPTRDGMSHTPDEYCSPENCVLGAQVLLGAVLRYDAERKG